MISRKGSSGRGPTSNGIDWAYTTCSSEPVFSTRSMAVRAASSASSEPSVASRTFVGNTLMLYLLLAPRLPQRDRTAPPCPHLVHLSGDQTRSDEKSWQTWAGLEPFAFPNPTGEGSPPTSSRTRYAFP